jgi:hypothetical protein
MFQEDKRNSVTIGEKAATRSRRMQMCVGAVFVCMCSEGTASGHLLSLWACLDLPVNKAKIYTILMAQ